MSLLTNLTAVRTKLSLDMLKVHIAPVGFEVDRIVTPAINMKADRVWLILHSQPGEDQGLSFAENIESSLRDANIECKKELASRIDLFDTLRAFREIITKEQTHAIFVNVSVGSKIQAIAAMMACMMYGEHALIRPYYVVPDHYATVPKVQETVGVKDIKPMPEYKIEIPSNNLIRCLEIIGRSKDQSISKKELRDLAMKQSLIIIEKKKNEAQSAYMALNKNLLEPLEKKWGFIDVHKVGNKYKVSLTEEGKNALTFLGQQVST